MYGGARTRAPERRSRETASAAAIRCRLRGRTGNPGTVPGDKATRIILSLPPQIDDAVSSQIAYASHHGCPAGIRRRNHRGGCGGFRADESGLLGVRVHAMKRALLPGLLFLVATSPIAPTLGAQELDGPWWGALATPAGPLTVVVEFAGDGAGVIGVPSRGVEGLQLTDVGLTADGRVSFMVPADGASFSGTLDGDAIEGSWSQAGMDIPLTLRRGRPPETGSGARPQTPTPPFPYRTEEVTLRSEGVDLACSLTGPPESSPPGPGVVLLTVAGANDRDQTHAGHKPYLVLADHLTREGMTVLRCDDRGVGRSGGDLTQTTLEELSQDALVMVRHLHGTGLSVVGIVGNSEGSVVGAMTAARHPDEVGFVVLLGGVGVTGRDVIRERLARTDETEDSPGGATSARFDVLVDLVLDIGGVGLEALERERPDLHGALLAFVADAATNDPFLPSDPMERAALFAGPWYHSQLTLDGAGTLEQVQVPVLALTGSKDRVNLPDQNLPAMRRALERGGNPDFTVDQVPDLNHVFQTAIEGGLAEYALLSESFAPVALERIARWIGERFGPG